MNSQLGQKKVILYILITFIFSIGMRMVWVYQFQDQESFFWNNQFMINTNDGYYYAEGARDILAGFHQPNDLSPINTATSKITAFFATIFSFSFESIIFYMPAFLSSLIVVPLVLIGKSLKNSELGFIAALLASIAWSYYNRTMVGYYDTDMLNIVFPTFLLWSLVLSFQTRENKYLLANAIVVLLYNWWYPGAFSLEIAFLGLILFYTLIYECNNIYTYKLITLMLLSMMNIQSEIKLIIIAIVFMLFVKNIFDKKGIFFIFGLSIVALFVTGGIDPVINQLKAYVIREETLAVGQEAKLNFFSVMQTVREAGNIPFEVFANRISGHIVTFFLSIFGFIFLCWKHPVMLLGLPLLGLGFLAYNGGLRFTVYAVPVMALGVSYLIIKITEYIQKPPLRYLFMGLLTVAILVPNIIHVRDYKVPTVFNNKEVKVLDNLHKTANREDYVISWWDYGYPIRYYADVKTLVDGGKHSGEVNFAPSYILRSPQKEAANMARLEVEYTERGYQDKNNSISNIAQMTEDYGFDNVNSFLDSLKNSIDLPNKTRDIYLYLPYRMIGIYPTVTKFSLIDLMTGKMKQQPFLYQSSNFKDQGTIVNLDNGVLFNKKTSIIEINKNQIPIKNFYITEYDKNGKLHVQAQELNVNGVISIVFARSYNTFLVMDEKTLNSTYMQLFLLERYDKKLFKPIELNPYVKVYKLLQ